MVQLSIFFSLLQLRPFQLLELSVKIESRIRFVVNVVGILVNRLLISKDTIVSVPIF